MPHPYGHEASQLSLPLEVVARHGVEVDRSGRFPEEAIAALGAAGLLAITATLAAVVPARRAASVDPATVLRT